MRELIKEYNIGKKTLQLLGGSMYTVRGINGDKMRNEDFALGKYDEAKEFYETMVELMKKAEGIKLEEA